MGGGQGMGKQGCTNLRLQSQSNLSVFAAGLTAEVADQTWRPSPFADLCVLDPSLTLAHVSFGRPSPPQFPIPNWSTHDRHLSLSVRVDRSISMSENE